MADPIIIALDCGSTNFKAALFDGGLFKLSEASLPIHSFGHGMERVELNADDIWKTTQELIQLTCQKARVKYTQVSHVAITSQAQTFILLDENHRPLTPLISWLDRRATVIMPQLRQSLGKFFSEHSSFPEPLALLQVAKLFWLKINAPELLARTSLVAPLPTWLSLRLGGSAIVDDNLIAMSGLYSLQACAYWQDALDLCGICESQLPMVVKAGSISPGSERSITLAGNDQTCGAIANDCSMEVWLATLGTALVAYRLAGDRKGPYHPSGCWGPFPLGGYYELATQDYGCAALDWAHQTLFPGTEIEAFFKAAMSAVKSLPGLNVLFYPNQIETPSAWFGEGSSTEMALAVLAGIGFELRRLIFTELEGNSDLQKIAVIGGGSRNDFWLQLLADILGIVIQRGDRDSLAGAARLVLPETIPASGSPRSEWIPTESRVEMFRDIYQKWCGLQSH
jgi:sugar (pentulose or hexulose) kinase